MKAPALTIHLCRQRARIQPRGLLLAPCSHLSTQPRRGSSSTSQHTPAAPRGAPRLGEAAAGLSLPRGSQPRGLRQLQRLRARPRGLPGGRPRVKGIWRIPGARPPGPWGGAAPRRHPPPPPSPFLARLWKLPAPPTTSIGSRLLRPGEGGSCRDPPRLPCGGREAIQVANKNPAEWPQRGRRRARARPEARGSV